MNNFIISEFGIEYSLDMFSIEDFGIDYGRGFQLMWYCIDPAMDDIEFNDASLLCADEHAVFGETADERDYIHYVITDFYEATHTPD